MSFLGWWESVTKLEQMNLNPNDLSHYFSHTWLGSKVFENFLVFIYNA